MKSRTLRSFIPWLYSLVGFAVLAGVIFPNLNPYYQSIFMIACINIVLACSLTLINGFTGQFSLGHAGFMAVGAYTTAALSIFLVPTYGLQGAGLPQQINFFVTLIGGGLFAALCGYVVGLPSLRLKGDYLAIVTLGFGEIIGVILQNTEFLGGARGLSGIVTLTNEWWLIAAALATAFCAFRLLGTPTGRAMFSVREDEIAAEAMGVNTTSVKVKTFVLSSFWAGVAGGLFAHYYGYLNPSIFNFMKSFEAVVIIVLGGLGSVSGAILAAIGLTILPEALRPLQEITRLDFRMIIYSLILILFMLLKPNGLLGRHELTYFWRRWKNKGAKK